MLQQFKGFIYALIFIVLNLLYLIIELSFNARLLDVSSGLTLVTDFKQLELYGRSISAAGATIFFWRLLVPFNASFSFSSTIVKFLLIFIIVFPVIFVGQKKLVDYLVDTSSAEARRAAEVLSLLKFGIAHGFVEIDELSTDAIMLKTAEGKMFVALSGLLIYSSDEELKKLESKLELIANYAMQTQQQKEAQKLYKNYRYAADKISLQYEAYSNIVQDYLRNQSLTRSSSMTLYENAIHEALLPWRTYEDSGFSIQKFTKQHTTALQEKLQALQYATKNCVDVDCMELHSRSHITKINQQLGVNSQWKHWCDMPPNDNRFVCPSGKEHSQARLTSIAKNQIIYQFGFERFYNTRLEYLQSDEFFDLFKLTLEKRNVSLLTDLSLTAHDLIIEEINLQLTVYNEQVYQQKIQEKFNTFIPPRLTLAQFSQTPFNQNYFRHALGEFYSSPLPIDLSQHALVQMTILPVFAEKTVSLINKLEADSSWYATDAPYETSGKNSLRNLLVPPIAIAMSLIFGLLNFINLVLNILFILIKETTTLRVSMLGVLLAGFIVLPGLQDYKISDQPAYINLVKHTQHKYGESIIIADWIARTEPYIYPIGHILRTQILNGFKFD